MVDITTSEIRSRMMSAIRAKNTKPEMLVRQALHRHGFRFRLHVRDLPGTPDLVLPRYRAVIFVNGCFWHRHQCALFKMPSTRTEFWREKLSKNQYRDARNVLHLRDAGWRVATVWECSLRAATKAGDVSLFIALGEWLKNLDSEEATF